MKDAYKEAFGRAPEGFERRVAETLREVEGARRPARPRWRVVVAVSLVAVLLLGAAYAAVSGISLTDFFDGHYRTAANREAEKVLAFDGPLATMQVGDVVVHVRSAVADGHNVYLMTEFIPATENDLLVGLTRDDPPLLPADIGGRRLVGVRFGASVEGEAIAPYGSLAVPYDFRREADGRLVALNVGVLSTGEETIEIHCEAARYAMDGISAVREESEEKDAATFTIPVTRVEQTRRNASPVRLEGWGWIVESLTLSRTPLTTYFTLEYTPDPEAEGERHPLMLYFTDASGEEYGYGVGPWNQIHEHPDGGETWTGTLTMDALPEAIGLMIYSDEVRYGDDPVIIPLDIVEGS